MNMDRRSRKGQYREKDSFKNAMEVHERARANFREMRVSQKGIYKTDLLSVLQKSGFLIQEELKIRILDFVQHIKKSGRIDEALFNEILEFLGSNRENAENKELEFSDYLDAFVAMGGNMDKTGAVTKQRLKDAIIEFELSIDIEEFLSKIPSDDIDFDNFCMLFDTKIDDNVSHKSFGSVFSQKLKSTMDSFHANYTEFKRYENIYPLFFQFQAVLGTLSPKLELDMGQ